MGSGSVREASFRLMFDSWAPMAPCESTRTQADSQALAYAKRIPSRRSAAVSSPGAGHGRARAAGAVREELAGCPRVVGHRRGLGDRARGAPWTGGKDGLHAPAPHLEERWCSEKNSGPQYSGTALTVSHRWPSVDTSTRRPPGHVLPVDRQEVHAGQELWGAQVHGQPLIRGSAPRPVYHDVERVAVDQVGGPLGPVAGGRWSSRCGPGVRTSSRRRLGLEDAKAADVGLADGQVQPARPDRRRGAAGSIATMGGATAASTSRPCSTIAPARDRRR